MEGDDDDDDHLGDEQDASPCTPGDDLWHDEALETEAGGPEDILVDARGVVHASWGRDRALVIATREGAEWRRDVLPDVTDWFHRSPLAADGQGALHFAAVRGTSLLHATNRTGTWETESATEDASWALATGITIGPGDVPWIVLASDDGLALASPTDGAWEVEAIPGGSRSVSVAVNVEDDAVLVAAVTDVHELELAARGPQGWTVATIDQGPVFGRPRFTRTAEGSLRLGYHADAPREFRSVLLDAEGTTPIAAIPAPPGLESAIDFAFEPDGTLHVAEATLDGVVHAEHRDGTWRTTIVAPPAEKMMGGVLPAVGTSPRTIHLLYSAFAFAGPNVLIPVPRHAWRTGGCAPEEWDGGAGGADGGDPLPTACPREGAAVRIDDGVEPDVVLADDGTFTMTWGRIDWTRNVRRAFALVGAVDGGSCAAQSIGDGDPPVLAGNAAGDVVAIRGNDFGPNRVWASFRPAGGEWDEPALLPEPAGGFVIAAAVDGRGGASAVGSFEGSGAWAAHADPAGPWTAILPASSRPPEWTGAPAVAANEAGASMLAWVEGVSGGEDWNASVWWSWWADAGWTEPAAATESPFRGGSGTQLGLADDGGAIATWFAIGGGGGDLRTASFDPENLWAEPEVLAWTGGASGWSALAVSPEGEAVLAWPGESVRVAVRDPDGTWTLPSNLPGSGAPWSLDAAISSDGEALVAWSSSAGDQRAALWASRRHAGRWSDPIPVSETAGVAADRPRIALASDGRALVAWHEIENPGEHPTISSVWATVLP